MLHRCNVEWPCLSIDFVMQEKLYPPVSSWYKEYKKETVDNYPYNCYLVAGGQTDKQNGYLYTMLWSNMHKTKYDEDPDKGPDSDEEDGKDPIMKYEKVQVKGNINRLKTMKNSYLCAYWSDFPNIEIVDIRPLINDLNNKEDQNEEEVKTTNKKKKVENKNIVIKTYKKQLEGFGLDWSVFSPGVFGAGGQEQKLEIYYPKDETCSSWIDKPRVLAGHTGSIEDLVFSPSQDNAVGTCSSDSSILFWDLRVDKSNQMKINKAHNGDVNSISWNSYFNSLVASGGDDGSFKVWDLRNVGYGPVNDIKWHKKKIIGVNWDPFDDSQLAVISEDNRLSIWDFSVEPDDKQLFDESNSEIPHQLVFLHQGQTNIKDLKFHPFYKNFLATTAENGMHVFKPAFDDEGEDDSESDEDEEQIKEKKDKIMK